MTKDELGLGKARSEMSRADLYAMIDELQDTVILCSQRLSEQSNAITALIAERDALADKGTLQALRDANDRAEAAEAQLKAARETLEKLACRHVTEQPLWWQIEARALLKDTPDE